MVCQLPVLEACMGADEMNAHSEHRECAQQMVKPRLLTKPDSSRVSLSSAGPGRARGRWPAWSEEAFGEREEGIGAELTLPGQLG